MGKAGGLKVGKGGIFGAVVVIWEFDLLCNQCLSSLKFESCSWQGVLDTTLNFVRGDRSIFLLVLQIPLSIKLTAMI